MKKASMILALAMAAIPGAAAIAQPQGYVEPVPAIEPTQLLPGQVVADSPIVGLPVYDPNGDLAGTVAAVVVGAQSGRVAAVLIDVRGFLGSRYKTVGVMPGDLIQQGGALSAGKTKRDLQRAPSYNLRYLSR
jgi:hypothetical protein